ncbi:MAG: MmcB family DNA repair protein [Geminicoccaceae bacterium]
MTKVITGADDILRGVGRALADADHAVLAELPLGNGRRADLAAIDHRGTISLVEIKSCRADFLTDRKWREYLDYCDRFYFAVAGDFPRHLLPADEGLILADRFGGEIVRAAALRPLGPARRKAILIRFGRAAAGRLQTLFDPQL